MVSQAASQSRFRALKHENGITGRSTIVVRVIACFQPLQNCQAKYFRQLLKPVTIYKGICLLLLKTLFSDCSFGRMVTAEESQMCQQFSAWDSNDSNRTKLLPEQNCSFIPSVLTANLAFPVPKKGVAGLSQVQHPSVGMPNDPCLYNFPQHGLGVSDKPIGASCAPRKRFIIFDRSGNRTRFFVGPSFHGQNNIVASKALGATSSVLCGKVASGVDQHFLVKPVVEEEWAENSLNDGEGEMLEDAEEINALLYSDSDDEYEYDDDDDDANDGTDTENDEASSTRHTPLSTEDWENKGKSSLERAMEQVGNGDGSPKRRKLLDGSCKKSSLGSNEGLVKGEGASSCESSRNEKNVKIHEALEILGSIVPGSNSKDPLSVIEKAIVYLENMKIKAKALGVS